MLLTVEGDPVVLALLDLSCQAAAVNLFPVFGHVGEDVVVRLPHNRLIPDAHIREPPVAGSYVPHLPVEHGETERRGLDERLQEIFRLSHLRAERAAVR